MTLEEFRKARSARKHADILAAGLTVFRRDGYSRATMEAIAREASVSTATLYRHFPSKPALFEAVATDSLAKLAPRSDEAADGPLDGLVRLAHRYADALSEPDTRRLVRMLVSETGDGGTLAQQVYTDVKARVGALFEEAVAAAAAVGEVRADAGEGPGPGQLQGMIEHATLMRGLLLGDEAPPADAPREIARAALETWLARWGA